MLNLTYIRDRATALHFSDAALALMCDVSPGTLSSWLCGEILPRPRALTKLAKALQSEVDRLIESEACAEVTWIGETKHLSTMDRERAALCADDMSRQLKTLRFHLDGQPALATSVLPANSGPDVKALTEQVRRHREAGNILVPVRWSKPLQHYVAAVVRHSDSEGAFVYVNLKNHWRSIADALSLALEPAREQPGGTHRFLPLPASACASSAPLSEVSHVTFVAESERLFETPVFRALKDFQRSEGGCDAAFVSSLLGMHILDAYKLAQAVNQA